MELVRHPFLLDLLPHEEVLSDHVLEGHFVQ